MGHGRTGQISIRYISAMISSNYIKNRIANSQLILHSFNCFFFYHRSIVTRSYYRGAAGALLVYDTTSRDSFNALTNWLNDARTLASPNIVILLVGNKKDLEECREVTMLEASNFAQENDLIFLETSAKTGDNVEEAFLKCSKTILAKIEAGELDPERIGSGIQYGDAALRSIQIKQRTSPAARPSDCGCRM